MLNIIVNTNMFLVSRQPEKFKKWKRYAFDVSSIGSFVASIWNVDFDGYFNMSFNYVHNST